MDTSEQSELDLVGGSGEAAEKIEEERDRLLASVGAAKLDTMLERVAWVLNRDSESRDSDVRLMLKYWEEFEDYDGGSIDPEELYARTRLPSISRARARIQNTYGLYAASAEVAAKRRQISQHDRERLSNERPNAPLIIVAADESGKQGRHLIVASVWSLASDQYRATNDRAREFVTGRGIKHEFHFAELSSDKLPNYEAFVDHVIRPSGALSFRAVAAERAGLGKSEVALERLLRVLLLRGVEAEVTTRRAVLPRALQVWKDLEDKSRDKLVLEELRGRMKELSDSRFNGQLTVEEFSAVDSAHNYLIQIADLFAGSLNRFLNGTPSRHFKDVFAARVLDAVGWPNGLPATEQEGDATFLLAI